MPLLPEESAHRSTHREGVRAAGEEEVVQVGPGEAGGGRGLRGGVLQEGVDHAVGPLVVRRPVGVGQPVGGEHQALDAHHRVPGVGSHGKRTPNL